jgi:hypothetical protein
MTKQLLIKYECRNCGHEYEHVDTIVSVDPCPHCCFMNKPVESSDFVLPAEEEDEYCGDGSDLAEEIARREDKYW